MTCNLSLQAENDSKKKMEKVEEVDPQEVFRQLVLDGRSLSLSLSYLNWTLINPSVRYMSVAVCLSVCMSLIVCLKVLAYLVFLLYFTLCLCKYRVNLMDDIYISCYIVLM